jgi:hypothetical protein
MLIPIKPPLVYAYPDQLYAILDQSYAYYDQKLEFHMLIAIKQGD